MHLGRTWITRSLRKDQDEMESEVVESAKAQVGKIRGDFVYGRLTLL